MARLKSLEELAARARRIRRCCAPGPGRSAGRRRTPRFGCRLPRRRAGLRARGRGLPRRAAPARRRPFSRSRRRRPGVRPRERRRPRRIRRRPGGMGCRPRRGRPGVGRGLTGGARHGTVGRGHPHCHRERVDCAQLRSGAGRIALRHRSDRDLRRGRVPRSAGGGGRVSRRITRHPHHQARDQGTARPRRGRPRRRRPAARRDRRPRRGHRAGRVGHHVDAGRTAPPGESGRRLRAAGQHRARCGGPHRPEAGPDRRRTPLGRGGAARRRKRVRTRLASRLRASKSSSAPPTSS